MPQEMSLWSRVVGQTEALDDDAARAATLFEEITADGVVSVEEHRRMSRSLTGLGMRAAVTAHLARLGEAIGRAGLTMLRVGHAPRDTPTELDEMFANCAMGQPAAPVPVMARTGEERSR